MTLQEAHKTGRKYRRTSEEGCDWWRFGVTDAMANTSLYGEEIFADDWEVEQPEVYEVECLWQPEGTIGASPYGTEDDAMSGKWRSLIGKRTKLTIEVLG